MKIIGHRGCWTDRVEKNSRLAFEGCFDRGFGTETDVRDFQGQVVISHDVVEYGARPMQLGELFDIFNACGSPGTLALNVKSDGLAEAVKREILRAGIEDYVLFDMSVPDTLTYRKHQLRYLVRASEYEHICQDLLTDSGIWLDGFRDDWFLPTFLENLIEEEIPVYIVSSELHGRNPSKLWEGLKRYVGRDITLCTDWPELAREVLS